jgi:multidrug efflux pump subunit AcrA (membrane-fusion protein)
MQSVWRSGDFGQIQEGDQVWPGQPFMKIVDSNSMQVEARINQVESEDVHIGQLARVNFDAFPGLRLEGKVRSVGAMGVGGWNENYYIRNLPVVISLQTTDSRVIPDLSASGDIVVGHKENVLLAPLEAVEMERGKPLVYVKRGSSLGIIRRSRFWRASGRATRLRWGGRWLRRRGSGGSRQGAT